MTEQYTAHTLKVEPIIDIQEKERQENELEDYFLNVYSGKGKINVLAHEAGFGKTKLANKVIAKSKKKLIYVKKYNSEAKVSKESILNELGIVYESDSDDIIVIDGLNSYSYEHEDIDKLQKARVLIISHKRYQLLAGNPQKRNIYTKDREILIIDEFLEPEIVSFDKKYFDDRNFLFPFEYGQVEFATLYKMFSGLTKVLRKNKTKRCGTLRLLNSIWDLHEELLAEQNEFGEDELSEPKLEGIANLHEVMECTEKLKSIYHDNPALLVNREVKGLKEGFLSHFTYQEFFGQLEALFSHQAIYDNYNQCLSLVMFHDFWTLDNNIMLDASARVIYGYKLRQNVFTVRNQPKVFFYNHTTCHYKLYKVTKSDIKNKKFGESASESIVNYFNEILYQVVLNNCEEDKTLVMVDNKYKATFNRLLKMRDLKGKVDVAHHGSILGKNDWRDFNKVYLTTIYNAPPSAYILLYSFFSQRPLTNDDLRIYVDQEKGRKRFKNRDIEKVQYSWQVHQLYQELKRINRDLNKKADFYVITNDDWILESIPILFKGINMCPEYKLNLEDLKMGISQKQGRLSAEQKEGYEKCVQILKSMYEQQDFSKESFFKRSGIKSKAFRQYLERAKETYELLIRNDFYEIDMDRTFENRTVKRIFFKD